VGHEHDPNKPTEMCDDHLREHAATLIAELLARDLLVIGEPHGDGSSLTMKHVNAMGIDNGKVYIAIDDGHDHAHDHDHDHAHDHDH
jgi:hypothetical protein